MKKNDSNLSLTELKVSSYVTSMEEEENETVDGGSTQICISTAVAATLLSATGASAAAVNGTSANCFFGTCWIDSRGWGWF